MKKQLFSGQRLQDSLIKFPSVKEYNLYFYFHYWHIFINKLNNIDKKKQQNEYPMCSQDLK